MGAIAAVFMAIPAIAAALSATAIVSAGPLDEIIISDELNCQVSHVADEDYEFYPPSYHPPEDYPLESRIGACATQIHVDGVTYGPTELPGGPTPVPFTPVTQSSVAGAGTPANPFAIVTVVDVGSTGLRLTETDTYVVGQESYRTDVVIANSSDTPQEVVLYRAGDCYLQNSDWGYGAVDTSTGAVSCVGLDDSGTARGSRIIQWYPLTPGSNYFEAFYFDVWSQIQRGLPFPDSITNVSMDNAAGLSWSLTVPAGGSTTVSQLMVVSPEGIQPLATTKTADEATSTVGGRNGYTIEVSNPSSRPVTLDTITDALPVGFSYVAGSTAGATAADPSIGGRDLTWAGPLVVAANSSLSLHFEVTVAAEPGTYFNEASAAGAGLTVIPTGPTAPVVVEAAPHLLVEKTAETRYTRSWAWAIAKTADTAALSLTEGETATIGYRVDVDSTPVDADWAVDGAITITNPTPSLILVESVVDEVSGVGELPVSCPEELPHQLGAGETLVCTYSGSLPDAAARVNEATVMTGAGPVRGASAQANVVFGAPSAEIDRFADVTDTRAGLLGSLDATGMPTSFTYADVLGPFACGLTNVDTTARFVTNDTASSGVATWRVTVTVDCDNGCTQGTGYWKTHSEYGPASEDPAWGGLPAGADTEFAGSGDSWYTVFQTAPKGGNAWYLLAHPYMAARLNELSGAAVPTEVAAALAEAELLLTQYAGDQSIPKKNSDRDLALQIAGILGDYNGGDTGPGSC